MNILLAEDEVNIASFLERGLRELGHRVSTAHTGAIAWERILGESFHLLILDVIMPQMSGLELCRRYREAFGYASPVVMLTALGTTDDIVKGLEAGADDYVVKPFRFAELEARIRALTRRTQLESHLPPVWVCGDLELEKETHRVVRAGRSADLTVREYRLLEYLIRNQGKALSRRDIIRHVWDREADRNMNVVDVYVNYLRAKIDRDFPQKLIHTVSGVGYRMEA
jgi:DNA-binding response OmpR family regulator